MKAGQRTASFAATLNGKGEFLSGIADMDVLTTIPEPHLRRFKFSKVLLADSNLGVETLKEVLGHSSHVPNVVFEPISKEKSVRILEGNLLSHVTILKPNILQLRDLAYEVSRTPFSVDFTELSEPVLADISKMAETLFAHSELQGPSRLAHIVITVNKHGVVLASRDSPLKHIKPLPLDPVLIKSAVGCGDSFLGGLVYGLAKDLSLLDSIDLGQRCALRSLQSLRNVAEDVGEAIKSII